MLLGKFEESLEICQLSRKDQPVSAENDAQQVELRFVEGCVSRALGKIENAVESFESVLKANSGHLEAHDHLYGFTCGLRPYRRNGSFDSIVEAFRRGNYGAVVEASQLGIWTRWLGVDAVLVLLASSLACLRDSAALYELGHRGVRDRPDSSITWYCVGLFYQLLGRSDEARRYLFKAGIGSKLKPAGVADSGIGPAWIALGHSFAAYGDHDQAVSAYVAAVRTHSPGSIEPPLFLAIEYMRVRQPVLAAAYLVDAHAIDAQDARVLNELAVLQAGKENYPAALKLITKSLELSKTQSLLSLSVALNYCIISAKAAMLSVSGTLESLLMRCVEDVLQPVLGLAKRSINRGTDSKQPIGPLSIFPWIGNSAHASPEHGIIFTFSLFQEWRALLTAKLDMPRAQLLTESALDGYRLLLECRNEHRNPAMEPVIMERQYRLLTAHSSPPTRLNVPSTTRLNVPSTTNTTDYPSNTYKTPRTPLIRSHSLTANLSANSTSNSSFLSVAAQTPVMSFSAGNLPTAYALGLGSAASSIAASVSRRRLSLRRQMTGLRFDPTETLTNSFSSFDSDNNNYNSSSNNSSNNNNNNSNSSFISSLGARTLNSIHLNEELEMTTGNLIANQSMILLDDTDESDNFINEEFKSDDFPNMQLDDSDN
jgi:tetratricopeptide (TPR) repeat protein